jgi:CelD/BcsL family acetyltransferase involved in cellulose biosynthesis
MPNANGGQSFGYREGCRRRRRLQKASAYEFKVLAGGREARDIVKRALDWKKSWIEERGLHSRLRNDSLFADTVCSFFDASDFDARVGLLLRNGEPVAVETGFVHRDRFYADLCSYRLDQRAAGVGKIAFAEMVEWAGRAGIAAYDKGPPADNYKVEWTDRIVPVADRTLTLSLMGNLHGRMETTVKPMAKAAFLRLPPSLRNAVLRFASFDPRTWRAVLIAMIGQSVVADG